jgi:hypothetical protein
VAASKNAVAETPAPAPLPTPGHGRPSDWDAHNLGWTVQHGTQFQNTDAVPGQVFVAAQLPDPQAQRSIGLDPSLSNAGLIVVNDDEAAKHPGGPEAHDRLAGTTVYKGTVNAGTHTAPGAGDKAPATASTVDNVPA